MSFLILFVDSFVCLIVWDGVLVCYCIRSSEISVGYNVGVSLGLYITGVSLFRNFSCYYFVLAFVHGMFYQIKYVKRLHALVFAVGFNVYKFIFLPSYIYLKLKAKKRIMLFFSMYKYNLTRLFEILLRVQIPDSYKGKGFRLVNLPFSLKKVIKKR